MATWCQCGWFSACICECFYIGRAEGRIRMHKWRTESNCERDRGFLKVCRRVVCCITGPWVPRCKGHFNVRLFSLYSDSNHKPPKLEVPPDTFCAPQGSVAMFQCVFTGCPIPDVSWYHNGTRIQNDNKTKIRDIPFRGLKLCSLMIDGVTTRDVGNYQCIGSNIKGNLSSQVVQLTMRHNGMCICVITLWKVLHIYYIRFYSIQVVKKVCSRYPGISKRSVQTDIRHHCREDPRAGKWSPQGAIVTSFQTVTSIALNFQPLVGVKRGKLVGVTPLSKLLAYIGNGYTNWLSWEHN